MPLIPRYPRDIERFFENREWPRFPRFPRREEGLSLLKEPRMDVYETNGEIVAEIELPGVDPKNIEVKVHENVLRVAASQQEKKEEKGRGYFRQELSRGAYKRVLPLPVEVEEEKTEAIYEGGVLKVTIPKKKSKKVRVKEQVKVKVKTA